MTKIFRSKTEVVNSITHVFGILYGLVFVPLLISKSLQHEASAQIAGKFIYGFFFITTFLLSTLYHALHTSQLKTKFRILDHISIYFFIAATYTPFVLRFMNNTTGTVLLSLVWFFAVTGSFFKIYYVGRFSFMSVVSYLVIGLLFLFFRSAFFQNMPYQVILFIYCGVACYLFGLLFFLWRKWKYHHALWHLLVLAGGVCHFKAVWLSI